MSRISDLAGFTTAISTTEDLSVGIITASSFSGNLTGDVTGTASLASNLTGTPDTTVNNLTGVAATFTGNVTIGGTLTYQDVEHIDSVGIITAQQGIQVLANGLDVTGVGTFKSDVSIADKIIHTGDANTAIRFPAADTFTVETNGSERIRVNNAGKVGFGDNDPNVPVNIKGAPTNFAGVDIHLKLEDTSSLAADVGGMLAFEGVYTSGDAEAVWSAIHGGKENATDGNYAGYFRVLTRPNGGLPTEALRVDSSQQLLLGLTTSFAVGSSAASDFQVSGSLAFQSLSRFSENGAGPNLIFGKSRNASPGNYTVVQADDDLGNITFAGDDGTDLQSVAARIVCEVDGSPGGNDMPGRLLFNTTSDGASDPTERLRITSTGGVHFNNAELIERVNITAGKLSDNQDINLDDGMAHLFTTTETTTATPNIRITTGINTHMAVGDVISVNIITTAAAAGYAATVHIDGVTVGTNGGSLVWNGGDAPTEGGASGNDFYSYSIIKTASATYTVLANVANFA